MKGMGIERGPEETGRGRIERKNCFLDGLLEDNPGVNDAHSDVVNDDRV